VLREKKKKKKRNSIHRRRALLLQAMLLKLLLYFHLVPSPGLPKLQQTKGTWGFSVHLLQRSAFARRLWNEFRV
jgi:hypothetical protein